MAIEKIDSYVDRQAFAADTEFLLAEIRKPMDAMTKLANRKLGGSFGTTKETAAAIKAANDELLRSVKISNESAKAATNAARASQQEAKAREANAKAANAEAKAKETQAKASERVAKATNTENNRNREALRAYKSLQREYVHLRKVAEDFGASLGTNSRQYIEAAKRANELNDKLKAIDAGMGNHQRNVGNYASGFSGLSNSFNQITRELPAFANSVQTGFLAISNNLPIFFDEITKARKEITALRAAGEKAPTMLQALGRSFFTLGTALSLGVTALTVFGPEIIKFFQSLFQGTKALDAYTERQKTLNTAIKESQNGFQSAVSSVNELKTNIQLAKDGLLKKEEVLKQYNETIGKTTGEVGSLDEAEQALVKNAPKYIQMMSLKAAAQAALESSSKLLADAEAGAALDSGEQTRALLQNLSLWDQINLLAGGQSADLILKQADAVAKGSEQKSKVVKAQSGVMLKVFEDLQRQAAKIAADNGFNFFDPDKDKEGGEKLKTIRAKLFQDEQKEFQKQLEDLSKSESLSIQARQAFREQAAQIERELISENAAFELQAEKDKLNDILNDKNSGTNARINAQNEYNAAVQEITQKSAFEETQAAKKLQTDLLQIRVDGNKLQLEADKKLYDDLVQQNKERQEKQVQDENDRLSRIQSFIQTDSNILLAAENQKLAKLNEARAKGKVSDKQYTKDKEAIEKEIARIQMDSQLRMLQAELDWATKMLEIRKALGEDTVKEEEKIAEIRTRLAQLATKSTDVKDVDELSEAYKRLGNELKNLGVSLVNAAFERQKNEIQDQIDLVEKRKAAELAAIDATLLSEEEKAARIAKLNAKAASQKEQLEMQQRVIQQRQARFEKAVRIAEIIANTAKGVAAALPNIPLSVIVGAIGAAQLATVLATPIPKYKDGTDNHPGGLAVVGDGGKREVVLTPDGHASLTPSVDTLMNLPKGTQVFPDIDTFMKMNHKPVVIPTSKTDTVDNVTLAKMYDKSIRRLETTIRNKREYYGPVSKVKDGASITKYLNDQVYR